VNDRERAWRDYMEVLTEVITMKDTNNTQSTTKKIKACRKECYTSKQNSARNKRCRMRHNQMERKNIRQNMIISTGKYGKIVRSIKSQPRPPLPATATKHMIETGIEIQGTFASEIQKKKEK
jgi:hypothetical protein